MAGDIPALCTDLNAATGDLMKAIPPGTRAADVGQLPLMMLGSQADGSWRNCIGERATLEVYSALKTVITESGHQFFDMGTSLSVVNASARQVTIALAPDPDVEIRERVGATDYLRAAIEIKGGSDPANIHNRAGEAEKSHQKAKGRGASTFWTIIACRNANLQLLRSESPTTQQWFDIDDIRHGAGEDWNRLVDHVRLAMGI